MTTGLQDTYAYTFRTQLIITLKLKWKKKLYNKSKINKNEVKIKVK